MDSGAYLYDEDIRPIDHIEFNILGNKEIKEMSALGKDSIGIDIPDLYDNMEPKRGGLIDPRMGTTDPYIDCATCGLNTQTCVGHFGHIDLAEPVFHMGYIQYVKKILSCICLRCSKLLVYKNENELMDMLKNKSGNARFMEIRNVSKNVTYCQKLNYGCGTPVSKIKIESKKSTSDINIIAETSLTGVVGDEGDKDGKKKIRQILTPEICYDILKNISDIDCMIMGLDPNKSRPENMIYKVFPVPPVAVRPSTKADFLASSTMEDDLTHCLASIIKANVRNRKFKETVNDQTAKYGLDHIHLLQYHVATYYDNDSLSLPKSEAARGKPCKSATQRFKGKEGRVRGNLMGKRVDYSARTVITPDPTIDINQLGIPKRIAIILTFPEVVTPHNIDRLQALVKNGRSIYPGANFVFPVSSFQSGRRVLPIDLRYRKEKIDLRYGDIVERHIVDDDYVLLNRQPSLHKLSMMGHRIKVIDDDDLSTFRLCPNITTPYNADRRRYSVPSGSATGGYLVSCN
jgi:DNA-directed RNA polymerase II subunit RPB1